MSTPTTEEKPIIEYPDADGEPLADNNLQLKWIMMLKGGLDAIFRNESNVVVEGNLLWYPRENFNQICQAPDVMVIFGRPKQYRGSYQQWEEEKIAPQVVFEILSPSNRAGEMETKFKFYEDYGVEEYYIYDPNSVKLAGYLRDKSGKLRRVSEMNGFVSPLLGIKFDLSGVELTVYDRRGERFLTYVEQVERAAEDRRQKEKERRRAEKEKRHAETERQRAETERQRAEEEKKRAETERQRAEEEKKRAETERRRAEEEKKRADQKEAELEILRVKLRAAGIDPDA